MNTRPSEHKEADPVDKALETFEQWCTCPITLCLPGNEIRITEKEKEQEDKRITRKYVPVLASDGLIYDKEILEKVKMKSVINRSTVLIIREMHELDIIYPKIQQLINSKKLDRRVEFLLTQVTEITTQKDNVEQSIKKLEITIQKLNEELKQTKIQLAESKKDNEALRTEIDKLKEEKQQLENQLNSTTYVRLQRFFQHQHLSTAYQWLKWMTFYPFKHPIKTLGVVCVIIAATQGKHLLNQPTTVNTPSALPPTTLPPSQDFSNLPLAPSIFSKPAEKYHMSEDEKELLEDIQGIVEVSGQNFEPMLFNYNLIKAAEHGYLKVIDLMLNEANVDPNWTLSSGYGALQAAARAGQYQVIDRLLNAPTTNVNIQDDVKRTPLREASAAGHARAVRSLLSSQKINLTLRDRKGMIALHLAALNGKDPESPSKYQNKNGFIPIIKQLIDKNAQQMNIVDNMGRTALHLAVENNNVEAVKELAKVTDLTILNRSKQTAMDIAREKGFKEIIKILDETPRMRNIYH